MLVATVLLDVGCLLGELGHDVGLPEEGELLAFQLNLDVVKMCEGSMQNKPVGQNRILN